MKAIHTAAGLDVHANNGTLLGSLHLTKDGMPQRERFKEILNDVGPLQQGELRRLMVPIVAEMARQGIDSLTIYRDGLKCRVSFDVPNPSLSPQP